MTNISASHKGMVRSDISKPTLIFFSTARVHTTNSTVKILAAKMHCKYFLKIAEVTHFFCTRNRLYQRFVQSFLASKHSRDVTALCNVLSKGLAGYNIGNVLQLLKNTCSAF
jgi:hypothetical protein